MKLQTASITKLTVDRQCVFWTKHSWPSYSRTFKKQWACDVDRIHYRAARFWPHPGLPPAGTPVELAEVNGATW